VRRLWQMGLVLGLALVVLAGCTAGADNPGGGIVQREGDPKGFVGGTSLEQTYPMPDQVLTDTSGNDFNLKTSPSTSATLVFFGYTNCPDVCITVLADVAQAMKRIDPSSRQQIQMIFITTDPNRDTPAVIRAYLDRFDPSFIGLTGKLDTIKLVAGKVGVDISGMKKLPSGGYEVGHGAQVTGFDRHRVGIVIWTPSTSVGDLKTDFAHLVDLS